MLKAVFYFMFGFCKRLLQATEHCEKITKWIGRREYVAVSLPTV
jgi:hypothetical protein